MKRFVIIDLETTGNSPANDDKIIEVGIVVIEGDEIVDDYTVLLNPNKPISLFISELTGISDDDVRDAPLFHEKAQEIIQYFNNSYLVAHNVPFDLRFLNHELMQNGIDTLTNPVIDTVELARILFPQAKSFKLGHLANEFHLSHNNPHRALSDAYVTAELFLKLRQKINELPLETINHLIELEKLLHSDLYEVLVNRRQKLIYSEQKTVDRQTVSFRGLAFKHVEPIEKEQANEMPAVGYYLDDIYEEGGSLERIMPSYEKRTGQREMSEAVFDAFLSEQHALIEAETGTGKSLAYLIPAIFTAISEQDRIVISTYTTQLQSQLMEKEIPQLQKIIPYSFSAALLKGKQHYISLERFEQELALSGHDNYDIALTKAKILVWLTETETGDIDEIQLPSSGYLFFKKICTDAEGKTNVHSPWFNWSFYQKAKQQAQQAQIILTNHALLCTDLFNDYKYLPSYRKVIIDEAHHFEETAAKHDGLKLDYISMQYTISQFSNPIMENIILHTDSISKEKWSEVLANTKYELDDLFRSLYGFVMNMKNSEKTLSDVGRVQYRIEEPLQVKQQWDLIIEKVNRLAFYLRDVAILLTFLNKNTSNRVDQDYISHYEQLIQKYIDELELFFNTADSVSIVRWIEIEAYGAKNAVYLYSEPTDVANILAKSFFDKKRSVVLTSASLTMKNSFDFIESRLGLQTEHVLTKQITSPFSYNEQVQLLIPSDFPPINYGDVDNFIYSTCEAIISLAEVTKGRMLVLFTSYDMLKKTYYLLKEVMDELDSYDLIAQGITSGSRNRLMKNFTLYNKPILLGTSSFWEGIDIPGDFLASLVIVRLPFQPPTHPIYEAKAQYLKEQGKNAFTELALPHAVIRFKQGFGRLIRSKSDRGIVFVCDARVMTARYGKLFLQSIPKVPVTYDNTNHLIKKADAWYNKDL